MSDERERLSPERVAALLAELRGPMHRYPAAAVAEAIEHLDELAPQLLALLTERAEDPLAADGRTGPLDAIVAAFLLAEGRREALHPLLLRILSLPDEGPFDVFGDLVTEDMPELLWRTCGGDLSGVLALARERSADGYCRGACLEVLPFAWAEGALSREEAVGALEDVLTFAKAEEDSDTPVATAVSLLCDFGCDESIELIREVYELDLVDPSCLDWDHAERHLGLERAPHLEDLKARCADLLERDLEERLGPWVEMLAPA